MDREGDLQDDFELDTVYSDANYRPRNPAYENFFRFDLGWGINRDHAYLLLSKQGLGKAYFQRVGHEGATTVELKCSDYSI